MEPKKHSARFWIAIITTLYACGLVTLVIWRQPDGSAVVVSNFFTVWALITNWYFTRQRPEDKQKKED